MRWYSCFSVFMAARNLRAGRGDRRGALRLAMAMLLLAGRRLVSSRRIG